jgi:hypothetical protein
MTSLSESYAVQIPIDLNDISRPVAAETMRAVVFLVYDEAWRLLGVEGAQVFVS